MIKAFSTGLIDCILLPFLIIEQLIIIHVSCFVKALYYFIMTTQDVYLKIGVKI